MDNPEIQAIVDTRHRTKTNKTKELQHIKHRDAQHRHHQNT